MTKVSKETTKVNKNPGTPLPDLPDDEKLRPKGETSRRATFRDIFDFRRPVSLFACPAKVDQPNSTSRYIGPGFSIRCSNYDELKTACLEQDLRGNSWCATAGYHPRTMKQSGDTVIALKAFWHDIDVGEEDGKHLDRQTALDALRDHCLKYQVPFPNVMTSSGGGIHIYWVLTEAIKPFPSAQEKDNGVVCWKLAAEEMKRWVKEDKIGADPKRTADLASVLRMPGTHNHKPQRAKALVQVLPFDHRYMSWAMFEPEQLMASFVAAGGKFRKRVAKVSAAAMPIPISNEMMKDLMQDDVIRKIFEDAIPKPYGPEKIKEIMDVAADTDGDWPIVLERTKDGFLHGRWPMMKAVFMETGGAYWAFDLYEQWCLEYESLAIIHYKGDENPRSLASWRKRTWLKYKETEPPEVPYAMGSVMAKILFDDRDKGIDLRKFLDDQSAARERAKWAIIGAKTKPPEPRPRSPLFDKYHKNQGAK